MLSHKLLLIATATVLFCPVALAEPPTELTTSSEDTSSEDTLPRLSQSEDIKLLQLDTVQSLPDAVQTDPLPTFRLREENAGIKLLPGQSSGNFGPAPEERGLNLQFSTFD